MALVLKPDMALRIFVHQPGDELWLHFDYWLEKPVTTVLDKNVAIMDVVVSKIIVANGGDCSNAPGYKEIGQIKLQGTFSQYLSLLGSLVIPSFAKDACLSGAPNKSAKILGLMVTAMPIARE